VFKILGLSKKPSIKIDLDNKNFDNNLLFFNPLRDVNYYITIPFVPFNTTHLLDNYKIEPVNYYLLNSFLDIYGYHFNDIKKLPYYIDNEETDKACMYLSRKKVYFNSDFFNTLNAVGRQVVYYHELAHQVFNGGNKNNEILCDIYAIIRCFCEGYSLMMLKESFDKTLGTSVFNENRLKKQFEVLKQLDNQLLSTYYE